MIVAAEFRAIVSEAFAANDVATIIAAGREAKAEGDRFLIGYAAAAYRVLADGLRADIAAAETKPANVVTGTTKLYNGYYTAVLADGSHITFKVRDDDFGWMTSKPAAGTRWIGYLAGAENENDSNYKGCGFIRPDGSISIWSKYRMQGRICEGINVILGNISEAGRQYSLQSSRCSRCNRLLTRADSITAAEIDGLGPDCRNAVMGM